MTHETGTEVYSGLILFCKLLSRNSALQWIREGGVS